MSVFWSLGSGGGIREEEMGRSKENFRNVPDGLCGFEISNARTLMPAASASRSRWA